ncbi:ferrous iron transport protein B [Caldinitratiruptor microaerophilus]|uniref:Ferrous iron transport protein B n=1 Tax=Caldinitratiruptor microaerophilus TaxID=671077 RepID=A0AA35CPE1_9FIRM|nr:ferrous iron transport protein B [Caldinitratiruptor microaerophilus]BDG62368.1 ferrous iron transporter B [Caldinitratiruptor microaerophilus]
MSASCHGAGPAVLAGPRTFTVALAGNPNVGKTSLFNLLTGLQQHVGNWPGKTIERRDGHLTVDGLQVAVTDLPGTYSLSAHSLEEVVARDFLLAGGADLVVNVVDAANLERNLYLTTELLDLPCPVVIALNMADMAAAQGWRIDPDRLARALGVPVVPVVASRGEGLAELRSLIARAARGEIARKAGSNPAGFHFSPEVEAGLERIARLLPPMPLLPPRWVAIKLAEEDPEITARVRHRVGADWDRLQDEIAAALPDAPVVLADERYAWVARAVREATAARPVGLKMTPSDRVDRVVTHPVLGVPITILTLGLGIWGTFRLTAPVQDWIGRAFADLGQMAAGWLGPRGPAWAGPLVRDGVIAGLGAVAAFAPLIAGFFLFLGLLEDSGYFARAAFVLDRLLARAGLHGKAAIGLMIGYGCNVPAAMAARTAPSEADRLLSVLLSPLVICSARLVVISFFATAFFPAGTGAWVLVGIYVLGVGLVLAMSRLFRRTLLPGGDEPFFIELPPYRRPILRNVLLYAWQNTWHYLHRALTVIAPMTTLIWALSWFPAGEIGRSPVGWLGRTLAPLGAPLGLDWRMVVSLFTGFLAKEGTLSTLAVLYGHAAGAGLGPALRAAVTVPQALSFLVFYSFYSPCLATAVTIRNETGSSRWMYFSIGYGLVVAGVLALVVYRAALLLGG